jgi:2-amino-4-hydroxy-6-hydroxymethyldihydropteridine diphosphokinase
LSPASAAVTAPAAPIAYIGLGANLGGVATTPVQTLHAAVDALAALPHTRLQAASRVYISDPVDASGPPYFNQVARLATELPAETLLDRLQAIENRFGRDRPYRNAPRTLDLDLLMLGDWQLDTPRLTLPHPRMHQRLFVLMPLAELDAALVIPGHGTVADCLAAVQATQSQRCVPAA